MKSALILAALLGSTGLAPAASRWDAMDYGPFLQSSVTMSWATNGEDLAGITLKGLSIRLQGQSGFCFDTGLLRWAAAWTAPATNRWLLLHGTPFDGTHRPPERSRPRVGGPPLLLTRAGPGWDRGGTFADTRSGPFAMLPADHARWRGLFVNGERVVLHYTVGRAEVWELPGAEGRDDDVVFTRTIVIGPNQTNHVVLLAETAFGVPLPVIEAVSAGISEDAAGGPLGKGKALEVRGRLRNGESEPYLEITDRALLHFPASSKTQWVHLRFGRHAASLRQPARPLVNPLMLIKGGQPRYPEAVVTRGRRAADTAAYVVDTLTLPDENPWRAWMRPGGFDFFPDGRAAICTWSGDVWVVSGIDDTLQNLSWRRVATGLFQPLGLRIVNGRILVLGRDQITRLQDHNGDGEADEYENFNNDCEITANFHEFSSDLQTDPAGNLYFVKGAPLLGTLYWDPIGAHNGSVLQVSSDGRSIKRFATGLRAPNGMGVGPQGQVTCADNEGIWTPVCRLNWVRPGDFLGAVGLQQAPGTPDRFDPPLCWLPWTLDNSAGGQVWAGADWGPLSGELLHLSYGKCSLFHVLRDEPADRKASIQGGVRKLSLNFTSGICRGRVSPIDGQLYLSGLKGWQTSAARDGCLERVRYTGLPYTDVIAMRVVTGAIHLTFSVPLEARVAGDLDTWNLQRWNYRWSKDYGSDLYSVTHPEKVVSKRGELKGEPMLVTSVQVSADGRTAVLLVADLRPAMQTLIQARLRTADGRALPVELFGTINRDR